MNSSELAVLISAIAVSIADNIPDNDDLALMAAMLTKLGDTLATITVGRGMAGGN